MIISETAPARGAPNNVRRTKIVAATLLLATGFVLAGSAVATASRAGTDNGMASTSSLLSAPCKFRPGFCSDSSGQRDHSDRSANRDKRGSGRHHGKH